MVNVTNVLESFEIKVKGGGHIKKIVGVCADDVRAQATAHVHNSVAHAIAAMQRVAPIEQVAMAVHALPIYAVHIEWDDDTTESLIVSMDAAEVAKSTTLGIIAAHFDERLWSS
jgi:hypothetical protein